MPPVSAHTDSSTFTHASRPGSPERARTQVEKAAEIARLRRETISPGKIAREGAEWLLEETGSAAKATFAWGIKAGNEWLFGRPTPMLPRGAEFTDKGDWCVLNNAVSALAPERQVTRVDMRASTSSQTSSQDTRVNASSPSVGDGSAASAEAPTRVGTQADKEAMR